MKKLTALFLCLIMLFSVAALSSCAEKGFDYRNEDLSALITLAPFKAEKLKADIAKLDAEITDADVKKEINEALESAKAYYKKITDTEETVELGDTVGITYKGVLVSVLEAAGHKADGTNKDGGALTEAEVKALSGFSGGTTSSVTTYTVGSGNYIEDLDLGLIGHNIGDKNVPIPVTFPEDYKDSSGKKSDLAGKAAVFFTSYEYEYKTQDARPLDYGDMVAIIYTVNRLLSPVKDAEGNWTAWEEADAGLKELYEEEEGELPEGEVKKVLTLSKDNIFHAFIKTSFNMTEQEAADAEKWGEFGNGEFGKTYVRITEDVFTVDVDEEKEDGAANVKKEDITVGIEYTITVVKLASVRYFTTDEVDNGELPYLDPDAEKKDEDKTEDAGTPSAQHDDHEEEEKEESSTTTNEKNSLVEFLNIKTEDYKDYKAYFDGLKEDMQDARDIQIAANRYQAAFDALVEASDIASFDTNEILKELKEKYIAEIRGNIDYTARSVEASGYASIYMQIAGVSTVEEYAMSIYGYTKSNIDKQLPIDAEEYISGRLAFWQLLKDNPDMEIKPGSEEYNKGIEAYKEIKGDTFIEDYEYTEEQLAEALTWDKIAGWLADNYVEFTEKNAVGED